MSDILRRPLISDTTPKEHVIHWNMSSGVLPANLQYYHYGAGVKPYSKEVALGTNGITLYQNGYTTAYATYPLVDVPVTEYFEQEVTITELSGTIYWHAAVTPDTPGFVEIYCSPGGRIYLWWNGSKTTSGVLPSSGTRVLKYRLDAINKTCTYYLNGTSITSKSYTGAISTRIGGNNVAEVQDGPSKKGYITFSDFKFSWK